MTDARKPSFLDAFRSPRLALMLGLGFASGLPNPLTGSTLTAWLATEDVSLAMIGVSALFALPYNFKFLWAPLLDRYAPPWLGRRRGWMLIAQVVLLGSIAALGSFDPRTQLPLVAALALATAFFSASNDVVSDAYRTDVLAPVERASGAAVWVTGYRVALIVAGAAALALSDVIDWRLIYAGLALLMSIGIVCTLLAPTPESEQAAPRTLWSAVIEPILEFLRRAGIVHALVVLFVVAFYKFGDVVAGHMQTPFLLEHLRFSGTEVAIGLKGVGIGATIVGALAGGGLTAKWGLRRALIVFGLLQGASNVGYALLAIGGKNFGWMLAAIGVDNLMNGLGTAGLLAFLMSQCDKRFTAFQYALFSSLMTVPGRLFSGGSGVLVEHIGWSQFFLLSMALGLPAIALLSVVRIREDRPA